MKTTRLLVISAFLGGLGACSSSGGDAVCAEAGCPDAGSSSDSNAGAIYTPTSGMYKVTAYTPGTDECKFMLESATNSTDPLDWITVTVDGTTLKVGKPRGTPAMASLGEGTISGPTVALTRTNHVEVAGGSTCNYDETVTSTATLDDPTKKTIGLSVTDKLTNRKTCDVPAGVGAMCTTTWSWRLTFVQ
jgi:hypothetical protein